MRIGIYSERIRGIIENYPVGEPFINENIAEILKKEFDLAQRDAMLITNNKLKRMYDEGKLGRIEKGVYYVTKQTVFGQVKPDYDRYAVKMLTISADEIIGYESGASFFNRIGLSTLIPREIEVVSNNYRRKLPDNCHVTAKKPPVNITSENYRYLQMLDVINDMRRLHIDAENPEEIISSVIAKNKIDPIRLVGFARKFYPQRILPKVIDIIVGDDFTL